MTTTNSDDITRHARLTSGEGYWHTAADPDLGIDSITMSDGPHGLRFQERGGDHLGLVDAAPATCFPPAVTLGSTWDASLAARQAAAIATEARAVGVDIVLGPGVNIKRTPLCGRNFEYFSEDPVLSGALGTAWVQGLQAEGVGASLKHFAANNQETGRMTISVEADERTLREIYLPAFERVVRAAKPWTVMCAYNRINGVHASENPWLLTDVLRREWGYDGLVVSDWGAVVDRARALASGMDLEMPSSGSHGPDAVVDAIASGTLAREALDASVERLATLSHRVRAARRPAPAVDHDAHHELAREVAQRGAVLLRNDAVDGAPLLPLAGSGRVAVIGELARTPRYQGAGSSQIVPTRLSTALDAITDRAETEVVFAPGYRLDEKDAPDLRAQAREVAAGADVVIVFLGLGEGRESEGFDRDDLDLPAAQTALLAELQRDGHRIVVVLSHGGVVRTSGWSEGIPAILDLWLGGQAGGLAAADLLYGDANPSGRLAETVPLRLEDTPAFTNFPGEADRVVYGERGFVGYRWYDARAMQVAFPFGHGLSYTTFAYSDLSVEQEGTGIRVGLTLTNTGERAGHEIVQVYVGLGESRVARAPRELGAFAPVLLAPGERRRVHLEVDRDTLGYWDTDAGRRVVEEGTYSIDVGASSRDLRLSTEIEVEGDGVRRPLTATSTLRESLGHAVIADTIRTIIAATPSLAARGEDAVLRVYGDARLGQLATMPGIPFEPADLDALLRMAPTAERDA